MVDLRYVNLLHIAVTLAAILDVLLLARGVVGGSAMTWSTCGTFRERSGHIWLTAGLPVPAQAGADC